MNIERIVNQFQPMNIYYLYRYSEAKGLEISIYYYLEVLFMNFAEIYETKKNIEKVDAEIKRTDAFMKAFYISYVLSFIATFLAAVKLMGGAKK